MNQKTKELLAGVGGAISAITSIAFVVLWWPTKEYEIGVKVVDSAGEVPGVLVQLGTATTETNPLGIADFTAQAGDYYLYIDTPGYLPVSQAVAVNGNMTLDVTLKASA